MRLKHRYIICQALVDPVFEDSCDFNSRDIVALIKEKITMLYGDLGTGTIANNLLLKYFDEKSKVFVIRTSRDYVSQTWFAISCINEVKKSSVCLRALQVCSCERTFVAELEKIDQVFEN